LDIEIIVEGVTTTNGMESMAFKSSTRKSLFVALLHRFSNYTDGYIISQAFKREKIESSQILRLQLTAFVSTEATKIFRSPSNDLLEDIHFILVAGSHYPRLTA